MIWSKPTIMFKYFIYEFGQFFVNLLPLKISYALAIFLCDLHYFFSFRDRRAVKKNLEIILGQNNDISKLAREMFRNFGRYLVEFFRMETMVTKDFVKNNVRVENLEFIQQALEKGKGGIILTSHIGNWELGAVFLSVLGYPLTVIALPHNDRPVNNFFNQKRKIKGNTVVPTNLAIRQCSEALQKNKLIGIAADRVFGSSGEVIGFMGDKALLPIGPALFSIRSRAPIIPTFLIRENDGSYVLKIYEPIDPPEVNDSAPENDKVLATMQKYIGIVESMIKKYPAQWLMFREFSVN